MPPELLNLPELLDVPELDNPTEPPPTVVPDDPRPRVRLPGDNYLLSDTAAELADTLKDKDLFRRGDLVFHARKAEDGLLPMSPATFRTWCEQFLFCYRVRMTPQGCWSN